MRNIILFFGFVFGGVLCISCSAYAVSIGISPVSYELTGNRGDVIENQIKVYNPNQTDTLKIEMQVEDIAPSGEEGQVVVEPAETETYSLASWVVCEPKEFDLKPGEEKFVAFDINIPDNAEPGGYYGTILAAVIGSAGPNITGATIMQRVGALALLTVSGEMKEKLAVKDFSAPIYSQSGPVTFSIKFENEGTVHVKPTGLVTITDIFGKKVAEIGIPQRNVLPNSVRKIDVQWNKKLLFGGKYLATLSGTYGITNAPFSSAVVSFWVFAWKLGLLILAIFILIILARRRLFPAFRILIKGR